MRARPQFLFLLLSCFASRTALAQAQDIPLSELGEWTAVDATLPEAPPKPLVEDRGDKGDKSDKDRFSRLDLNADELKTLKSRLRLQLDLGLILFYYQPLANDSTLAGGSYEGNFQVFFYYTKLSAEWKGVGGFAEVRVRDGGHVGSGAINAYFRNFYTSNIWLQEAYAYYTPGLYLKLKAGKVYRQFGTFWDDSFFGNLPFFDGLKLNPEYGVAAEGDASFWQKRATFTYAAQFFLHSDGLNGGWDTGRTVGTTKPTAGMMALLDPRPVRIYSPNPEAQRDSGGALTTALRNLFVGRAALSLDASRYFGLSAGGSALWGTVQRSSAKDMFTDEETMMAFGADLTLRCGPVSLYGEYIDQMGPAVRDADYLLGGLRASIGPVALRFNVSYVDYHLAPDVEELIVQPGLTYKPGYGLTLFAEYNEWQRLDPRANRDFTLYDRSLNLAVGYNF